MTTVNTSKLNLEGLPDFLKPKIRLFLSVDIVGSTAAKQKADNFFKEDSSERLAEGRVDEQAFGQAAADVDVEHKFNNGARWLKTSVVFYETFAQEFGSAWSGVCVEAKRKMAKSELSELTGDVQGSSPKFWKAAGDEILFYKDITDWMQVVLSIGAWVIAMKSIRSKIQEAYGAGAILDVKGAAWLAGFPVVNTSLCLNPSPSDEKSIFGKHVDTEFAKSPLSKNLLYSGYLLGEEEVKKLLDKHGAAPREERIDFLGPLIDLGFRVSQHAEAERMAVSMEIVHAFLRANLRYPNFYYQKTGAICALEGNASLSGFPAPTLLYCGRSVLKGISGSRGYPIFKLDVGLDEPIVKAEKRLSKENPPFDLDDESLIEFCSEYFANHSVFSWPYLVSKDGEVNFDNNEWVEKYQVHINKVLRGHQERLDALKVLWQTTMSILKRIDAKIELEKDRPAAKDGDSDFGDELTKYQDDLRGAA